MKSLPQPSTHKPVATKFKERINVSWTDVCDGYDGCHYELIYYIEESRQSRYITENTSFTLLAPK